MITTLAKTFRRIGKDKRGFTIVELMAVFAILAVIAAIAIPQFTGTINAAKEKADKASQEIMQRALDQYIMDWNESPADIEELVTKGYLKELPEAQADGKKFKLSSDKKTIEYTNDSSS